MEQGYRYAINLQCDWIIVTSMRENRLYHKGSNRQTYERFETTRLATDTGMLKQIWENFRGLFRSVDAGNAGLKIPAYNGGLSPTIPASIPCKVPDDGCALFKDLADYDYRPAREVADADLSQEIRSVINVEILGHIFEQSITDLERIRQDIETGGSEATDTKATTRRKKEGAFYTPAFITRYIVERTLRSVLAVRCEALRKSEETEATATARKPLADPNIYDLTELNEPQCKALISFREAWQEVLKNLRILEVRSSFSEHSSSIPTSLKFLGKHLRLFHWLRLWWIYMNNSLKPKKMVRGFHAGTIP